MRVLVLASDPPSRSGEAVHAVIREVLQGLLAAGLKPALQLFARSRVDPLADDGTLAELGRAGLEVFPELAVPPAHRPGASRLRRLALLARPPLEAFYPTRSLAHEVAARARAFQADVAFVVWSPEGLAAAAGGAAPVFVYYGVPDHLAAQARLSRPELFGIPSATWRDRVRVRERQVLNAHHRRAHLSLVRACTVVANLCVLHVRLYQAAGHTAARYVPNTYPDLAASAGPPPAREPGKIVGSIGDARATGNTFGLAALGEVVPELRARLGPSAFRVHVYGRGEPATAVAAVLEEPEVLRRGWVPSLDDEILSASAFLVLNNAGPYEGAYTRFLHAWALRAPVIAHSRAAAAMPELEHGRNVLLGGSTEEIAACVAEVLRDPALGERLGAAGRETYERVFRPDVVVSRLLQGLRDAAAAR